MITPVIDHPDELSTATATPPRPRRRLVQAIFARLRRTTDTRLCRSNTLPTRGIYRILVCRPNHRLGNAVLISPLLRELEILYPGAEIDLLGAGHAAQCLYGSRFQVRHIFSLPRHIARHPWATAMLLRELRGNVYDLAIDPCGGSHSGQLLLGWCRARLRIGFPTSSERADVVDAGAPQHLAKRGVHALRRAYAGSHATQWPPLHVGLSADELQRGRQALAMILDRSAENAVAQPVFGVFANATGRKCFSEAWWQAFVEVLHARWPGIRVVNVLAEHGRSQLPGIQTSFYTGDLRKLAAVIANLSGFISADCGVMHLAAAVGTPTLGLFAATSRDKYTPYGKGNCGIDVDAQDGGAQTARNAAQWIDRTIRARTLRANDHPSATQARDIGVCDLPASSRQIDTPAQI